MLLVEASTYTVELRERVATLDEAVARSPGLASARWQRARARLELGDSRSAAADLEDIEAGTHGSANRFEVCFQAGRLMFDARVPAEAARFYQKALRYLPASADATAGLARALLAVGDGARAVSLLSRAVGLARRSLPAPSLLLELATALVDVVQDLPAAIAHARSVPLGLPESVAARALEGRWRAALGDLSGASQAYAQAREALESLPGVVDISTDWLVEAARFELDVRRDARTAQRHLATELQRHPHDPTARALFRKVGQEVAELAPPEAPSPPAPAAEVADESSSPEEQEAQIVQLTQQVQANPNDFDSVRRLCRLLDHVGRYLDLFALVSARLEESSAAQDLVVLQQYRVEALQALAQQAREGGRLDEAVLYEQALEEPYAEPS